MQPFGMTAFPLVLTRSLYSKGEHRCPPLLQKEVIQSLYSKSAQFV